MWCYRPSIGQKYVLFLIVWPPLVFVYFWHLSFYSPFSLCFLLFFTYFLNEFQYSLQSPPSLTIIDIFNKNATFTRHRYSSLVYGTSLKPTNPTRLPHFSSSLLPALLHLHLSPPIYWQFMVLLPEEFMEWWSLLSQIWESRVPGMGAALAVLESLVHISKCHNTIHGIELIINHTVVSLSDMK